jgi:DNA polymerase III subunit gamma/tau
MQHYQPFHLKYRPQILSEIVGQKHITQTLTNAITTRKIAAAYLFTGGKGTGKTSTARILAKSLNCLMEDSPTISPCGKCGLCKSVASSSAIDVTELDAASNSGVDNMRDLIAGLQFKPLAGSYKILIIDECHALSSQSWQALLKIVEEPPAHVVFIFATTEVEKVPSTIISRCQRFDFRKIPLTEVKNHLSYVATKENISIGAAGVNAIARVSKGHLRDSLKLLDQLSLIGSGEISLNWVWELSGTIPEHDLLAVMENIAYSEVTENLSILQGWLEEGKQPSIIHEALVSFLKALLVCKVNPTTTGKKLTQLEDDTRSELVAIAPALRIAQIQSAIALLMSRQNLMRDEAAALWLEATIIQLTPVKVETSQPWKNWKTPQDAIAWGKSNLPHLSQSEVERHWNQLEPVNGKKAGAWVDFVHSFNGKK